MPTGIISFPAAFVESVEIIKLASVVLVNLIATTAELIVPNRAYVPEIDENGSDCRVSRETWMEFNYEPPSTKYDKIDVSFVSVVPGLAGLTAVIVKPTPAEIEYVKFPNAVDPFTEIR